MKVEYSTEEQVMPELRSQNSKTEYETYLTLAGGRIRCLRCTAKSVRSGKQCAKPAMKSSRTQKCSHHGGLAIGPKTEEGRERIAQANTKHGESTRIARLEYSKASAQLSMLEDAMHVLAMTSSPRTRGRKPAAYRPVRTIEDVQRMLVECNLHLD
jgi:hypothetical protein